MAEKPQVKKPRPNIRQRRVAAKLKAWRDATGRSLEEVGPQLGWSDSKLNRYEKCTQIAGPAEIIALAAILGVPEAERDRVVQYAVKGQEGLVWWRAYTDDADDDFADFMDTESEATTVCMWESLFVPGPLQDDDYADVWFRAWMDEPDEAALEARRELRRVRRARLTEGPNPPALRAVIFAAALMPSVVPVPAPVLGRQIDGLLALGERPNVKIRVLTSAGGPFAGFGSSYHLMSFEGEEDVAAVYVENLTSGLYIESDVDVATYTLNFERLEARALDPEASAQWMRSIRAELT